MPWRGSRGWIWRWLEGRRESERSMVGKQWAGLQGMREKRERETMGGFVAF
ncbi:molecular chaperone SurA [Sesbania bispinosa]|nr:molecular chaperone SurA [Sesbania bispinosa]